MNRIEDKALIETLKQDEPQPQLNRVMAKASDRGPLPWQKARRTRLWRVLVPTFATVLALAIAVPTTWALTKQITRDQDLSSQQAGGGATTDAIKFLKDTAKYYYPSSIGNLIDSGTVYADLYYAFNDANDNYVVVALHRAIAKMVSVYRGSELLSESTVGYSAVASINLTFDWKFTFQPVSGNDVSVSYSFNLKPFYDSVIPS